MGALTPFRINTSGSVHSKQLYLPLESTLMKKGGRGGPVIVNQKYRNRFPLQASPQRASHDGLMPVSAFCSLSPRNLCALGVSASSFSSPLRTFNFKLSTFNFLFRPLPAFSPDTE